MKLVLAIAIVALSSCGGEDAKPAIRTFTVTGSTVSVVGRLKPGAHVSVDDAKAAAHSRVQFIDALVK